MYHKTFKCVGIARGSLQTLHKFKLISSPKISQQNQNRPKWKGLTGLNLLTPNWLFVRPFSSQTSPPPDQKPKSFSMDSAASFIKGMRRNSEQSNSIPKETSSTPPPNPLRGYPHNQSKGSTWTFGNMESAEIAHLREEAEKDPNNADKQLKYLQKLNQTNKPDEVVNRALSNKYAVSADIIYEMIKAMMKKYPAIRQKIYGGAGSSTDNPLFVQLDSPQQAKGFISRLVSNGTSISGIILLIALIYVLISMMSRSPQGGGISELFQPTYQQADKEDDKKVSFADVIGNEEAKEELTDIVEYLKDPTKFTAMGAKLPKGILLVGPPGCGKTLLARAVSGEAEVPFFFASGSEFEEMLVGVGARRVRALFNKAKEKAPCIIFIDEIDAVGGRRDALENRSKMTLNQMLVELDGFSPNSGVVVIAATNIADVLDPALVRPGRFDRRVEVTTPDLKSRKLMIDYFLKEKKSGDVDLELLAKTTGGFSGADVGNMVNIAAIMAVKRKAKTITMDMLLAARDDVMMGPARKSLVLTPETKKLTAYHEGGHALVALTLGLQKIAKATLVPRGHALGMVSFFNKDEHLIPKEVLLAQLDTAMAGRVAEELIFGMDKITPGAGSDFDGATQLAYNMVSKYGFSEKLGPVSFRSTKDISNEKRASIDAEVQDILMKSYERSKKLLTKNIDQLHRLADALLEFETLTEDEIKVVITGKNLNQYREAKAKELEKVKQISITVGPPGVDLPDKSPSIHH